jgi:predicted dehydrogenase
MSLSNGMNRRGFLRRGAGLVAGVITFPYVVPSSCLGKAGPAGRIAPSNRIVMGCIGVGGQGTRGMAGGIWAPEGGFIGRAEVQVVAVCDVDDRHKNKARDIVNKKYGNKDCAAYRDFRELLARDDIDAVLIATGDRWHPLISIAAAKAGKDTYCEKPISVTIEEAKAMRQAIGRYGTVFQMGTQQRSSWSFRFACELVRNGYIGRVKTVTVGVGGPVAHEECHLPAQPVPDYLDYDMWLGPIPWRPYHKDFVGGWMAYRDCSGGEMTNWGAHHFDAAQWGLGMDDSGPVEIIPPDGKDYPVLTYRYANGATVTRDPEKLQAETGQNNGVLFTGTEGKVAVWRYDLRTWPESLKKQKVGPDEIHLHESENHHTDFINSVRTRAKPGSNIDIGCRSITVCHLGNIAYELGRPLKWDPDKEAFVNDPQAQRMVYREMRSPWHL